MDLYLALALVEAKSTKLRGIYASVSVTMDFPSERKGYEDVFLRGEHRRVRS